MEILKAIKDEVKENWSYIVGAVIGGIIVYKQVDKFTRESIEEELIRNAFYNEAITVIDEGITLNYGMTYEEYTDYLYFKHTTRPNKKKRIEYLKEKGFIN